MIYQHTLDSFNLSSQWQCMYLQGGTLIWTWQIVEGPTTDRKSLTFPVSLPVDATIYRAWVSMRLGSPLSGAAARKMNGITIPSSGEVDVEGINGTTTEFTAEFAFRANGAIYQDSATHTSNLMVEAPTLNIEYYSESEGTTPPDENDPGIIHRDPDSGNQLPRLLNPDMTEVARIKPSKLSLDMQINPVSTAIIECDWTPDIIMQPRGYMELFDPNGSAGMFRITKVEHQVGRTQKAWLKHAIVTLMDDIAIGVKAMEGTFRQVVSSILEAQSVKNWALGEVALPDEYTIIYSHSYDTLLDCINGIYEKLPDGYVWEFDTLTRPWVMHLRALNDADRCEARMSRNLENVRITVDASDLATRVYPYGSGEGDDRINISGLTGSLFLDADTKSTWGTVARSFTEENIFDALTLKDVAELYLERRKNPRMSVDLDAELLYKLTGETLDKFWCGRLCRLALPEYETYINARVVSINYPDVYGQPGRAHVTLANRLRDTADDIASLLREATGSKLLGGVVKTEEVKSNAGGLTISSPMEAKFPVSGYGNLLSAKLTYTTSPSTTCRVSVDGNSIDGARDMPQPIDLFPYLAKDSNGVPTVGEHYVSLSPVAANSSIEHWIRLVVTLKTIEQK